MKAITIFVTLTLILLAASCAKVPPPTQEEFYSRDQWAAIVTEQDRKLVFDEVSVHTSWSEKRKLQYEIDRFQHIWRSEDRKARAATQKSEKAATKPTTRAATRATTHPTTQHMHTGTGHFKERGQGEE
jgi:hypothetical protein